MRDRSTTRCPILIAFAIFECILYISISWLPELLLNRMMQDLLSYYQVLNLNSLCHCFNKIGLSLYAFYYFPLLWYSRFQIFRHDIAKNYRINWLMRRIYPRKLSVRLISTELIPTRFIFTKEAYRAAPFSLQGTTFVLFNYIVPKYLKPTI